MQKVAPKRTACKHEQSAKQRRTGCTEAGLEPAVSTSTANNPAQWCASKLRDSDTVRDIRRPGTHIIGCIRGLDHKKRCEKAV